MFFSTTKDVVQFDLDNIFKNNLSDEVISNIKKILKKNTISINDKKYILYIVDFLCDNDIINKFLLLCLDNKLLNKAGITVLLNSICMKIQDTLKKENSKEEIDKLKEKIKTIILVSNGLLNYKDNRFIKILIKILNSNLIDKINYEFIIDLSLRDTSCYDFEKIKLLIDYILNNKIRNYKEDSSYNVFDILLNDSVLKLDNDTFLDVIKITLTKEKIHNDIIGSLITLDTLSIEKKKTIISYLSIMFNKGLIKSYCYSKNIDSSDVNIYSILFNEFLISLNDEDYKNTLRTIIKSNKPNSYVKVLANNDISNIKNLFALDLINQDEEGVNDLERGEDYKCCVAMSAISPVLINASLNDYIKILDIVNECCLRFEELEKEIKYNKVKIDKRIKNAYVAKSIVRLLQCPNIYSNNLDRLYKIIDYIIKLDDKRYLVENIIDFCVSPISVYYTDEEIFKIFSLMEALYTKDSIYNKNRLIRYSFDPMNEFLANREFIEQINKLSSLSGPDGVRILRNFFANLYVPFMEDRNILFKLVEEDLYTLEKITHSYNEKGNYLMNKNRILNDIDEGTLELVFGSRKMTRALRREG